MGAKILTQTIEYDNSARAWGQYDQDATLIRYHDDQRAAILAVLPWDLQKFVHNIAKQHPSQHNRALKAAVILAENRVDAIEGNISAYNVTGDSGTIYVVDVHRNSCTCPDASYGNHCKHLLAAHRYHADHGLSLWALAHRAIDKAKYDPLYDGEELWSLGTRSARLEREQTNPTAHRIVPHTYLVIAISGHASRLRIAILREGCLDQWWDWICRREDYDAWVEKIRKGR